MFLLKTYNYAYFKDVTYLFLHADALLPKHYAKDQDSLIEQSLHLSAIYDSTIWKVDEQE